MSVQLSASEKSVWIPASWGRDDKLTFNSRGDQETWFTFTDESGDTYGMVVTRPYSDHTLHDNGASPAIVEVTAD